jgi:hypothetical protein
MGSVPLHSVVDTRLSPPKLAGVPSITFTSHLQRHVECPPERVSGTCVREALEDYFARHPKVRGYLLDEQGVLRKHVVVFVGGQQAHDREELSDPVPADAEIYVMQALSGG